MNQGSADEVTWQQRLLPLMRATLAGLTVFFLFASLGQLGYLQWQIARSLLSGVELPERGLDLGPNAATSDKLAAARLSALAELESHVIERRYQNVAVSLMSRLWLSYLGFVTGMSMALVGAAFILGQLRTSGSELSAEVEKLQFTLKSASPGLLLATLGTILMVVTVVTHHRVDVDDRPVFVGTSIAPSERTSVSDSQEQPPYMRHTPPVAGSSNRGTESQQESSP